MPKLPQFDPPAYQNDFRPGEEEKEAAFRARWSDNINRFTEQTLQNDPWGSVNQPPLTQYYNPILTDIPTGTRGAAIQWTAFPNRILIQYPNVGEPIQWKYADEGPPPSDNYRPFGPRGWQDEYCEWSVTRNAEGKITKVMFTCENREYWYTLWDIDPNVVLRLYQELVGSQVKLEDLYLRNDCGVPVIDPATGRPAYDDRNPWNSTTTDGAVHLISNPNALSAEIFLAGQATILRRDVAGNAITDKNQLINCSKYGTPNRNSDPTIGAEVNALVRGTGVPGSGVRISLENPVGLYIQEPSFDTYQLPLNAPSDAKPSDYWKIIRGRKRQDGEEIDYILHAVYEVPQELGFTVSDIAINGFNIDYGAQIAQTFQIALAGLPLPQVTTDALICADEPKPLPRVYYLRESEVLSVAERSGLNMQIEPGTTVQNVVLEAINCDRNTTLEFVGEPGITVEITGFEEKDKTQFFTLTITVASDAPLGNRSVLLKNLNPDATPTLLNLLKNSDPANPVNLDDIDLESFYYGGPAIFGLLTVVAPGTLNRTKAPAVAAMAEVSPVKKAAPNTTVFASVGLPTRRYYE